jgi:hypothetical protein
LLFGAVGGVLELWADWVHVTALHSLVYDNYFGFKLFESPSYMPVAWLVTITQFGYIALRLRERLPAPAVVGILAALGMALPPWYEEFAAAAQAWRYTTRGVMLSQTPLWVMVTYGGCMTFIAVAALTLYRPRAWSHALAGGIFVGAGLMFSAVFAYSLVAR